MNPKSRRTLACALVLSFAAAWRASAAGGDLPPLLLSSHNLPLSEPALLKGHADAVESAAFSPDGGMLATAANDDTVKLWDAATGRELKTLIGHGDTVSAVAFSPDGATLASSSADNTVKLWNVATGREEKNLVGHTMEGVNFVAFSPDGRRLASAGDDATARIWDVASGRELLTLRHKMAVFRVAFSPDGKRLASVSSVITLWNSSTGEKIMVLGDGSEVAFSPDGSELALVAGNGYVVTLRDAATGRKLMTLTGHESPIGSIAFSRDGARLISSSAGPERALKVWDLATGRELASMAGGKGDFDSAVLSPDESRLASLDGKTVKLWDPEIEPRSGAEGFRVRTLLFRRAVLPGAYDSTAQKLALSFFGAEAAAAVPPEAARRFEADRYSRRIFIEGSLRYRDADHFELRNAELVDDGVGRFPVTPRD